jgi:hypothetical protein
MTRHTILRNSKLWKKQLREWEASIGVNIKLRPREADISERFFAAFETSATFTSNIN